MHHKNKTLATLLAVILGGFGAHRFYMYGPRDIGAWLHLATFPLSLVAINALPAQPALFAGCLFVISVLAGMIGALVIGLTPDARWDTTYNSGSGGQSDSGWPVILLVIVATASGMTGLIAAIARTFDLLFTGGAYG